MSDLTPSIDIEATVPSKKAKKAKKEKKAASDKPKSKPSHPPTALMVKTAIESLKSRGGSSLQAIKKYIAITYKVDAEKCAPFIKKYIKNGVTSGTLVQTKGKGASGSFKMAGTFLTKKASKKNKSRSLKVAKLSPKKNLVKKVIKVIKSTPLKAKSSTKMPTKKPKTPKPKTVKSKPGKSSKKNRK